MAEDFPGYLRIHHRRGGTYRAWARWPGRAYQAIGFKRPSYDDALRDLVTWLKRQGYEWQGFWEFFR